MYSRVLNKSWVVGMKEAGGVGIFSKSNKGVGISFKEKIWAVGKIRPEQVGANYGPRAASGSRQVWGQPAKTFERMKKYFSSIIRFSSNQLFVRFYFIYFDILLNV